MQKKFWLYVPLLALVALSSCKKENDPEPDENELITTVQLTLTANGSSKVYTWKDVDGEGGQAPVIDSIVLAKNQAYTYSVRFLDESKSPVEDVTEEIRKESDEHLVVMTPSPTGSLTVTTTDKDRNNRPIGLVGEIKTSATAVKGKLKVQLRHQPGVKDGSPIPGDDDANVDFDVEIK